MPPPDVVVDEDIDLLTDDWLTSYARSTFGIERRPQERDEDLRRRLIIQSVANQVVAEQSRTFFESGSFSFGGGTPLPNDRWYVQDGEDIAPFRGRAFVEGVEDNRIRVRVLGTASNVQVDLSITSDELEFEPAITSLSRRPQNTEEMIRQLVLTPLSTEQRARLARSLSGTSTTLKATKAALQAEWKKMRQPTKTRFEREEVV